MINPLVLPSKSCHYDVARASIFRALGNPDDMENVDEELRFQIYEAKKINWKFYTQKIKPALLKGLYNEFSYRRKYEYPKQKNIRAMREKLNELFPDLLGFGKLYDKAKVKDGYQSNKKRCPNPRPYQDSIYWSLLAKLDQENMNRRSSILR